MEVLQPYCLNKNHYNYEKNTLEIDKTTFIDCIENIQKTIKKEDRIRLIKYINECKYKLNECDFIELIDDYSEWREYLYRKLNKNYDFIERIYDLSSIVTPKTLIELINNFPYERAKKINYNMDKLLINPLKIQHENIPSINTIKKRYNKFYGDLFDCDSDFGKNYIIAGGSVQKMLDGSDTSKSDIDIFVYDNHETTIKRLMERIKHRYRNRHILYNVCGCVCTIYISGIQDRELSREIQIISSAYRSKYEILDYFDFTYIKWLVYKKNNEIVIEGLGLEALMTIHTEYKHNENIRLKKERIIKAENCGYTVGYPVMKIYRNTLWKLKKTRLDNSSYKNFYWSIVKNNRLLPYMVTNKMDRAYSLIRHREMFYSYVNN